MPELEKQKKLLRRIEKMAGIGHWHLDLETNEIEWSDEIYYIHGVSRKTFQPNLDSATSFYHPNDIPILEKKLNNAIENQKDFSFNLRLYRPDGELRYVESFGEPDITDGKVVGIFGVFRDITDQKTAELERLDSQTFMQLVMESIPDPIFVKDSKSRILLANSSFLDLYPADMRDTIIGTTTVEGYDEEEAKAFLAEDQKALREGYTETYETIHFPNGSTKTLFTKKVRIEKANGDVNLLGVARDVTELHDIKLKLERSNKDLQDFAFTVSHDLKAPLRHITMSASFLNDNIDDHLSDDQKEFMNILTGGAEKAQYMIDNLLEYSRIGRTEVTPEDVDLNVLVNGVLSTLSFDIDDKEADIILKKLPSIKGNKGLLEQLFQNLIENSLKYRKASVQPKIKIYAIKKGRHVDIHIEDNGIGIDPEFEEKIFLIFQRLHGDGSEYEGLGIGLSICKKIMRAHNGEIKLDRDYKGGTAFILSFPPFSAGE